MISTLWATVIKWCVFVAGLFLVLFGVRQSGKESANRKAMQETLKGVRVRDKVEDIIATSDITERQRLRKKWTRK